MKNCEGSAEKTPPRVTTFRNGRMSRGGTLSAQDTKKPPAPSPWRAGVAEALESTSGAEVAYALKLDPQPQVDFAFGFTNLNPAPCRPST